VQDNSVNIIEVDLTSIIPDNFSEIPYITQINAKKKVMETFNNELERLVTKKSPVANKDYNLIFNVVTHMLEDSNALVYMEAIKTVEYLSILMGKAIKQQKMRQFVSLLADKYKETKTASVQAVNKALQTLIMRQCIPYP
jgi:Required for nuclear transport of RNA pol II C-terminus 1